LQQPQFFHKLTLVCDDVRREDNGKLIIIGVYTPDIRVAQIPFVFPSLTFLQWLETSQAGQYEFRSSLNLLEDGKAIAQIVGMTEAKRPGVMLNVLRLMNLRIQSTGTYTFTTRFEQHGEPIIHSFQINLS
jgi:hypothetical protein